MYSCNGPGIAQSHVGPIVLLQIPKVDSLQTLFGGDWELPTKIELESRVHTFFFDQRNGSGVRFMRRRQLLRRPFRPPWAMHVREQWSSDWGPPRTAFAVSPERGDEASAVASGRV